MDIIKRDGNLLNNSGLSQQFFSIAPPALRRTSPEPLFSFYNSKHRHALTMLVDWVLSLEFLPALSLLVKMKELASTDLFVEVLTLSVVGRPDCGLVMPDREAINPELFFCKVSMTEITLAWKLKKCFQFNVLYAVQSPRKKLWRRFRGS